MFLFFFYSFYFYAKNLYFLIKITFLLVLEDTYYNSYFKVIVWKFWHLYHLRVCFHSYFFPSSVSHFPSSLYVYDILIHCKESGLCCFPLKNVEIDNFFGVSLWSLQAWFSALLEWGLPMMTKCSKSVAQPLVTLSYEVFHMWLMRLTKMNFKFYII